MRENYTVKVDRCLRRGRASTARYEDAVSVTSNSATQESTLSNEPGLNARNTETNIQEIQKLESQIENLRAEVNGNLAMQAESTVCASPQTSTTIWVTDVGRPNMIRLRGA